MIETTLSQLRQLKLNGMASALQTQLEQPGTYEGLSFAERLQLLTRLRLRPTSHGWRRIKAGWTPLARRVW
jgi:hypothetical protein